MQFVYFFSYCCFGVLTLLLESVNGNPVYDYSYIQAPCDYSGTRELTLGANGFRRYGYIEADNDGCYNPHLTCSIRLTASSGYQITTRFHWVAIELSDVLIISEAAQTHRIEGYFTPAYSIYSTTNWMNLQFVTSADIYNCFGGFRLYYTSYHYGDCADNEFRCPYDGRCIPSELRCDHNDNCGDWSDEWDCGLSTGAIVAISVSCALVGIALIAALFYGLYRHKHRRSAGGDHRRSSSYPPPTGPHTTHADHHVSGAQPIGPPKYSDVPPAYGFSSATTTTGNPVYEDIDHHHHQQSTFTTAPYNGQNNSVAMHYDNNHAYTSLVHNNNINNSHSAGHM